MNKNLEIKEKSNIFVVTKEHQKIANRTGNSILYEDGAVKPFRELYNKKAIALFIVGSGWRARKGFKIELEK